MVSRGILHSSKRMRGVMMAVDRRHMLRMMGATIVVSLGSAPLAHSAFAMETSDGSNITISYEMSEADVPTPYSFSTSFSLKEKKTLRGVDVRGTSLTVAVSATCPKDGNYSVSVYKGGTHFGAASFKRNGFTRATWNNLVPGTYIVEFSKPRDGYAVNCTRVTVY